MLEGVSADECLLEVAAAKDRLTGLEDLQVSTSLTPAAPVDATPLR